MSTLIVRKPNYLKFEPFDFYNNIMKIAQEKIDRLMLAMVNMSSAVEDKFDEYSLTCGNIS